jgi:VIT1/CCC1 family predicted Fe2+/Mn2+ transporter
MEPLSTEVSDAANTAAATPIAVDTHDATEKRAFILHVIQPGLAGLMDGSVSSLAPLFASALATRNSHTAFIVGMATAVGAGISMAFSEALSDDGKLSGRGSPITRGLVCGAMTFVGAAGHALPFLIPSFNVAMTVAMAIVVVELFVIAWVRHKYMETPLGKAAFQIIIGGVIVFLAGILIGKS